MSDRLDQYVAGQLPVISRAFAARLVADGKVLVNGAAQTKPGYKTRAADAITIDFDPSEPAIPDIKLPILYEDDDCVVITKPAGILTHNKGVYNPEATVASWLRAYLLDPNWQSDPTQNRAGIVHRLDRLTSGVLIAAKHQPALSFMQKQFSQRKVKKSYRAILAGVLDTPVATIDVPIERNPKAPATFRPGVNGKSAQTAYRTVVSNGTYTAVEFQPTTGRTHQLRVHAQYIGHPIVGDILYGGEPADRLYLHAHTLELTLPNRERKVFVADVPASFEKLLPGANHV